MHGCARIVAQPAGEIPEGVESLASVSSIANLLERRQALFEQRLRPSVVGLAESDEPQIHEREADALGIAQLPEACQTRFQQPTRPLVVALEPNGDPEAVERTG